MTTTFRGIPNCPYDLGPAGSTWWRWAWKTDQSQRWDTGATYTAARRAQLEDERAALHLADNHGLLADLLQGAEPDAIASVTYALGRLAASATGSTGMSREMRELESQLGLNPKAVAALKWTPDEKPQKPKGGGIDEIANRRAARLAGQG